MTKGKHCRMQVAKRFLALFPPLVTAEVVFLIARYLVSCVGLFCSSKSITIDPNRSDRRIWALVRLSGESLGVDNIDDPSA